MNNNAYRFLNYVFMYAIKIDKIDFFKITTYEK